MDINSRISALRQQMQAQKLDAYVIPSSDPHQSEYAAEHWKSRSWISGFTGSAGLVVVTPTHAGVWTDSRYFLQAEEELENSELILHKQGIPHAPEHIQWLKDNVPSNGKVGCDGMLFAVSQIRSMANAFYEKNIDIDTNQNLIPAIWADRPPLPSNQIFEHDIKFAGKSRAEKLGEIRAEMTKSEADFHLVSTLDDIAWIFNVRSNDVECNPVTIAYAIIGHETAYLFIAAEKVGEDLKEKLRDEGIFIKPYENIKEYLSNLPKGKTILVDSATTSNNLYTAIPKNQIKKGKTIARYLKAIKNDVELEHINGAMIKDGLALTKLYRWLEAEVQKRSIPEVEVAEQLIGYRKAQGDYFGESFSAIVGYKGNGAIVHYRPMPETCASIKKEGILLLDSGGQYLNGTTDITRTSAMGTPTDEQKTNFTLVLKGHIALATIKFPKGTKGIQLDTLARMHLWNQGLNYGHGTGHGVGFFLNVHEPPQGFAETISLRGTTVFETGMFTSNEPGFYKTGEYGIRIENLIVTTEAEETPYGQFLQFKTVTLFPIDLALVDETLLTPSEKEWLNNYHQEVFDKLSPLLDEDERAWMKEKCRVI